MNLPQMAADIPPVRITSPNGSSIVSTDEEKNTLLSNSFNRDVHLATPSSMDVQFRGYIPEEIEELDDKGTSFTRTSPKRHVF